MKQNHGFKPDIIKPEDYIFGAKKLPEVILRSDGQWDDFLPPDEEQEKNGLESMNCSNYGTLHCLAILLKRIDPNAGNYNFSERYTGVESDTSQDGNTPQTVIETIRKICGLIPESELPFDQTINTWEEYYSPKPMTARYLKDGQKFLAQYTVGHEWVKPINETNLMNALKCSPLGVGVYAWEEGPDGLYVRPASEPDCHWVCLYGFEKGKFWKVFDSYDNTHKKLAWDFGFNFAKRYHLLKKNGTEEKEKNWLEKLINIIKAFLKL